MSEPTVALPGAGCVRAGQAQFAQLLKQNPERNAYHEAKEQELREYLDEDVAVRAAARAALAFR